MADPKRVLIVDDQQDVLNSTSLELNALGYEAFTLSDPSRVLEFVEREHPNLILQDLKMKDLNVAGLVASLRSNPASAEIPIVFFSASPDIAAIAAKYDAWGYLRKPFTEVELVRVLEKALGEHAPEAPAEKPAPDPVLKDVRAVFHDYWNLLSALNSYAQVLRHNKSLTDKDRQVLDGLEEVIVKLEAKTDRLQSYLRTVLA